MRSFATRPSSTRGLGFVNAGGSFRQVFGCKIGALRDQSAWGCFMICRLTWTLSLTLFVLLITSECLFAQQQTQEPSTPASSAQDSSAQEKKDEAKKGAQPSKADEAGKPEAVKGDPAKDGKSGKVEKAKAPEPEIASPKLITIQPDDTTYTSRPKTPAVFVFKNGDKIESDDFLITREAVFINKEGKKTRYPIATIDQEATRAANEGRGVVVVFPKSKSEFNLDF